MDKILILAYFFPPCNLTAANRIKSLAEHAHENGFYPIIISRKWEIRINDEKDEFVKSSDGIEVAKDKNYEVHYLPYKPGLKESFYFRFKYGRFNILYFLASLFTSIFDKLSIRLIAFNNIYGYAKRMLKKEKDINYIIASAYPFSLFQFSYRLKKEFPSIKWIADYRDDWSTNEIVDSSSFIRRCILKYNGIFEKRWLKSALFFTTVNKGYVRKITNLTGAKGYVITNGYISKDFEELKTYKKSPEKLRLAYSGTVWDNQPLEVFLKTVSKFSNNNPEIEISLSFYGAGIHEKQRLRIDSLADEYNLKIIVTGRLERSELIEKLNCADVLMMFSYADSKNTLPSKIFEYLALKKPILLFKNDNGMMADILNESGLGILIDDEYNLLSELNYIQQNLNRNFTYYEELCNINFIHNFSRQNQAKIFYSLLKEIQ